MNNKLIRFALIIGFLFIFLFFSCLYLTGCAPLSTDDIINSLLPNIWVFASHLIATIIILCLVIWLGWKPTKASLEKRRLYIEDEIKTAERNKRESLIFLKNAQDAELAAHTKAHDILESAEKQAFLSQEKIQKDSKLYADKIIADARDEAIKLHEKIKIDNYHKILDIAFTATEALVKKNIKTEDNNALVEDMIKDLSKEEGK